MQCPYRETGAPERPGIPGTDEFMEHICDAIDVHKFIDARLTFWT